MLRRRRALGFLALGSLATLAAAPLISPWPGVLAIRALFGVGAARASAALERHVPPGIVSRNDIPYDPADGAALLDLHRPSAATMLPAVVWLHGGAFVSGSRRDVANYLRILAGQGFATVGVGYSIAPGATYPTPLRQLDAALAFLLREGTALGLDPTRIVLAGDSAGAQLAAQMANLVTAPAYARAVGIAPALDPARLRGALLFCGPYDLGLASGGGIGGLFMRTVLRAYSGTQAFATDPDFARMSVVHHLTPAFPPSFVSAGNADPLLPHSVALAEALRAQGVPADTLFFPPDHVPPLPHEYQFDLDVAAGRLALRRATEFLRRVTA